MTAATVPFHAAGDLRRHVEGLTIAEAAYEGGFRMAMHAHEPAYLGLVLRGAYDEACGRAKAVRRSGSVIFHTPGERHAVSFEGATILRIELGAGWLARAREAGVPVEESSAFRSSLSRAIAARLRGELRHRDGASALAVESLVLELLVAFARKGPSPERGTPRWLSNVIDMLHDRAGEPLTLRELAATAGVHPTHLARTFRRFTGTTVGGFLRELRLDRARRQIVESDLPLVQIALENGFSDQSHLCRWIARTTGLSPRALRGRER